MCMVFPLLKPDLLRACAVRARRFRSLRSLKFLQALHGLAPGAVFLMEMVLSEIHLWAASHPGRRSHPKAPSLALVPVAVRSLPLPLSVPGYCICAGDDSAGLATQDRKALGRAVHPGRSLPFPGGICM